MKHRVAWLGILALCITGCTKSYPPVGTIERISPELDKILAPDAHVEKLAEGFTWVEGPVWFSEASPDGKKKGFLLFDDIPENKTYRWEDGKSPWVYLKPSGYTGTAPRGGEVGSNGLTVDNSGRLILCQHGDRQVARLEGGKFVTLADKYDGKRFNSPNDVVVKSNGDVYFTDPPYGLEKQATDPAREMDYCGVYRIGTDGKVTLLTRELTFPNGLCFSPDEKTLYVTVSDPEKPNVWSYPVKDDGTLGEGKILFNAKAWVDKELPGMPDGIKVDKNGIIFATGPGGIFILSPTGEHLGTIATGDKTANCNWGGDGSVLYMTMNHAICRIQTLTSGRIPGTK